MLGSDRGNKVAESLSLSNDGVQGGKVGVILSILQVFGTLQVLRFGREQQIHEGVVCVCVFEEQARR